MKRTTLIAAVCAVLIAATGFAAAAPGNAPVSVDAGADDTETKGGAGNAAEADDRRGSGAAGPDRGNGQGPSVDLPEQVPEHVSAIHDRISAFLNGALDGSLGEAVSAVTPGDDAAGDSDEAVDDDRDGDATEGDESDEESIDAENGDHHGDESDNETDSDDADRDE